MMRKAALLIIGLILLLPGNAQSLQERFSNPPEEASPWTFWYWMHGAVSKEGIRADLKAMQEIGLGGAYLMPIRGPKEDGFANAVNQLTPEWWEMVRYSMEQADSLGLKLGMHISDGFALAGGPWISAEESMQKLVWTDTIISGGKKCRLELVVPDSYEGFYRDIAVYALPVTDQATDMVPVITSNHPDDPTPFTEAGKGFRSTEPVWIQYEYPHPFTLRNVEVLLFGNNYQSHRFHILSSNDGKHFEQVSRLTPARHGWQNSDYQSTHAVKPTTARYFRFYWDPAGSEPGSEDLDAAKWRPTLRFKELRLNSTARIHQWEGKAGFVWRVAEETPEEWLGMADCTPRNQILNISKDFKKGVLQTQLPPGKWRILRMGHTSTGHMNATGGGGKGLECDKFSQQAVKKQFDNWFGAAFRATDEHLARRVLKFMHVDSWECGSQNWSSNFATEFLKRRGYDLMPLLPVLAGYPVESTAFSEKVLRDVRETIAELVPDVFYKVLAEEAHKLNCEFSAECVSPTMVSDGMLHYKLVDRPMGEFWLRSPTHDKPNDMFDAIHGAHIYGKNIIQAEGFTQLRTNWDEHPGMLKTLLDYNLALGVNKMFMHVFVHNPYTDRAPGMTLDGIGLYFQRDQTWWKQGKAWIDYMRRCQTLLQYGTPVVDIAVYTGEEIPRRAILPDRLVPFLPGLFGEKRVQSERRRLLNEDQPLRVMPAGVTHSANMADPDQWIDPLRGYSYDSFNKDALLQLATAGRQRMNFPGGASYRVLVIPGAHRMNPDNVALSDATKKKIAALKASGVYVPELPYSESDFSAIGLEPDVMVPEQVAWNHRSGPEAEIYFISNQMDSARNITVSLRYEGREPELWNPQRGTIESPSAWQFNNNRTEVQLKLAPRESTFIILRACALQDKYQQSTNRDTTTLSMEGSWDIHFLNTNRKLTSDSLFNWTTHQDNAIRYYSGEAVYRNSFSMDQIKEGTTYFLQPGDIRVMARVLVNGKDCGTLWTAPYELDITQALHEGLNELEITVVNTWANAIQGMDEGQAPFKGIWTDGRYRKPDPALIPSGLTGTMLLINEKIQQP